MFHSGFRFYPRGNSVVHTCKVCNKTVNTPRPLCQKCEIKARRK